jgi:hypothetical protein
LRTCHAERDDCKVTVDLWFGRKDLTVSTGDVEVGCRDGVKLKEE